MNNYMRIVLGVLTTILLIFNHSALANDKAKNSRDNIKCHVALANNSEVINTWITSNERLDNFQQSIVGTKIYGGGSKDKIAITKVYQCVPEDDEFSNASARQLDKATLR